VAGAPGQGRNSPAPSPQPTDRQNSVDSGLREGRALAGDGANPMRDAATTLWERHGRGCTNPAPRQKAFLPHERKAAPKSGFFHSGGEGLSLFKQ